MELSIDEIIDYSRCPMYYFLKYKSGISTNKIDLFEKYENELRKIIFYSFAKLQEGEIIRIEDIKQMWGRLWVKSKRRSELIFSDTNLHKDTYNIKRVKGLESLLSFRDYIISDGGYPIAIDQQYRIKIENVTIRGKFDIVREVEDKLGNKTIQVCLFKTDNGVAKLTNKYDLKLHCDALALEKIVNQNIQVSNMVYYIEKGKVAIRNKSTMEREIFIHNVLTISNLIKNNVYYMSVNDNCQRCTYKDVCSNKANTIALIDSKE